MRNTKSKPKWKPGDLIKTIVPKHGTNIYDASWIVAIGIILESNQYFSFDLEKKETYYKILIQNAAPTERHSGAIYPIDTPDEYIIEKENEIPF